MRATITLKQSHNVEVLKVTFSDYPGIIPAYYQKVYVKFLLFEDFWIRCSGVVLAAFQKMVDEAVMFSGYTNEP